MKRLPELTFNPIWPGGCLDGSSRTEDSSACAPRATAHSRSPDTSLLQTSSPPEVQGETPWLHEQVACPGLGRGKAGMKSNRNPHSPEGLQAQQVRCQKQAKVWLRALQRGSGPWEIAGWLLSQKQVPPRCPKCWDHSCAPPHLASSRASREPTSSPHPK